MSKIEFFNFFGTERVTLWVGDNTNLPSNSNISKTERANVAFTKSFLKSI